MIEADLDAALEALAGHGVHPRIWRLPYGEAAEFSPALAEARGLAIVRWTADSYDWRGDDAGSMLAALTPQLLPQAILLMHDGVPNTPETAALVEPLVHAIRAKGLEPGRIGL